MAETTTECVPVVITGVGLVCRCAASARELLAGAPAPGPGPGPGGAEGAWFDPVRFLGPRGFKYLTPATRYLLASARLALEDAGLDGDRYPSAGRGVVVGTNFAAAPVLAELDRVVQAESASGLSPAESPNFSVNIPASHVSMRHGMRAFNVSLTNPMVAGLESLVLLKQCIDRGRARMGLAAATEDRPGAAAARAIGAGGPADGACSFVLERLPEAQDRGARLQAVLVGGFSRFVPPESVAAAEGRAALAAAIRREMVDLVAPGDVVHYSSLSCHFPLNREVDGAVRRCLEGSGASVVTHEYPGSAGEYFTVSPLLQAAASVAENGAGLVVAVSPHGHVAAVAMRSIPPHPDRLTAGGAT